MAQRRVVNVLVFCPYPCRVLLLRRPASRAAGWQSVTGRVEAEDADGAATDAWLSGPLASDEIPTLVRACVREIHEETGLPPPAQVLDLARESVFVGYDGVTYCQRTFAARYDTPWPIGATPEHEEGRWVSAAQAMTLLTWDADRESLRAILATFPDAASA